jgi:hypothetical protein
MLLATTFAHKKSHLIFLQHFFSWFQMGHFYRVDIDKFSTFALLDNILLNSCFSLVLRDLFH